MTFCCSARIAAAALALSFSSPAFAAGQHAGDHGGGHAGSGGGHPQHIAFGHPGDPSEAARSVSIVATDHAFSLPEVTVKSGETVRFVIRNEGEFLHEFTLGTPEMHQIHQAEMLAMMESGVLTPTGLDTSKPMAHGGSHGHMAHDDPNSVLVGPGETKEIVWTFQKSGKPLLFACNVPGHYESGMHGDVKVGN